LVSAFSIFIKDRYDKVKKEIEVGDHILFVAEVTKSELRKKGKRLFHLFADQFTTTVK